MSAGMYRTPVTLSEPVFSRADDGSQSLVYVEVGQDFASLRLLGQAREVRSGAGTGVATHEIRLRYRDDLSGGWRLTAENRGFLLLSVVDADARRRELRCLAEEEGT